MRIRPLLQLLVFAFWPAVAGNARANEFTLPPPTDGGPIEVHAQLVVLDLTSIDGANQNFTANFAYGVRWMDPRLKHDGPGHLTRKLEDIWHPRVQIVNRQRLQETFPDEARVSPDGEVTTIQRFWGQLSQPLELVNFPFDSQTLNIQMVAAGHEPGTMAFMIDQSHLSALTEDVSISDWTIAGWKVEANAFSVGDVNRPVPGVRFQINVKRSYGYHMVNIILPLVMIVFMSWVVFWIHPKNINPRVGVSVTAMLTLIAYRFAVGASLPKISYLTRMDWFILGSSILVFASLLEVVLTTYYEEAKKPHVSRRINWFMRISAPVMLAIILFGAFAT